MAYRTGEEKRSSAMPIAKGDSLNFYHLFTLLRQWFAPPTPAGPLPGPSLSLKTWWPRYTTGDFRLEICVGALLVHQVSWRQVRTCLYNLQQFLQASGKGFDIDALLSIPLPHLETLLRPSRFPRQKSRRLLRFCRFLQEKGGVEHVFSLWKHQAVEKELQELKIGFGPETRDCILLYAVNRPVFIADAYARRLLHSLGVPDRDDYDRCQQLFQEGIQRDFTAEDLAAVVREYRPEELRHALCNTPPPSTIPLVLLYQQFHAGIVELGISRRWEAFRAAFFSSSAPIPTPTTDPSPGNPRTPGVDAPAG
ncbi:MAG: hypothetical protein D6736_04525 [Nitrospinota bacterium]|nr:MAG: hypothetical protein D6736_04525 [Nitrospinota bacterium]